MADRSKPRIDLRPGPFLRVAASRLDIRSRRGFPVTTAGACAVLAFLGFLSLAGDLTGSATLAMDRAATALVALLRMPLLTRVLWIVTLMGDTRVMVVETLVAAVLLAIWGHPRRAGSVILLLLTGVGVSSLVKGLVSRPRPLASLALIAVPTSASFPSGHALSGFLLFGTLALMLVASRVPKPLRTWGAAAVGLFALTIGLSRVYLGVHYFSDVLAGWLLGTTMLATWAAAVLAWGRTQPSIEERPLRPWGQKWWRWAVAGTGLAIVAIAIVAEMPRGPLL
jgi:undecaprenyl-diphosphatase